MAASVRQTQGTPKPTCWECGSQNVTVRFLGYLPVFHKTGECACATSPCSEVPSGQLTCGACGNVWKDGNISEFYEGN